MRQNLLVFCDSKEVTLRPLGDGTSRLRTALSDLTTMERPLHKVHFTLTSNAALKPARRIKCCSVSMWLDRFGTHNSPQQSSVPWRKGSPLPQRRPSQLYTSLGVPSRPVIQQRDSSWYGSVTSNSAPTASSPLGLTAQLASPHDEPALLVTALATVDTLLGPVDPTDTADDARAVETSDFEGASLTSFANGNDNVTTDSALSADSETIFERDVPHPDCFRTRW